VFRGTEIMGQKKLLAVHSVQNTVAEAGGNLLQAGTQSARNSNSTGGDFVQTRNTSGIVGNTWHHVNC
jgi:hypothetical protein